MDCFLFIPVMRSKIFASSTVAWGGCAVLTVKDNISMMCSWITFCHWAVPLAILEAGALDLSHHFRYLLYDVNPPEGFNLRRDVYIRMASLVKTLTKDGDDWVLVLPPWGRLYHWQSPDIYQLRIPWGEFFSLTSLQVNVPVIEYEEFIAGKFLILLSQDFESILVLSQFNTDFFKSPQV